MTSNSERHTTAILELVRMAQQGLHWRTKARAMAAEARRYRALYTTEVGRAIWHVDRLHEAVNASCTCGGAGPGEGCPACEVWHRMRGSNQ